MKRLAFPVVALLAMTLLPAVAVAASGSTVKVTHLVEVRPDLTESVRITVTYDTTHYWNQWDWVLPSDAVGVHVSDELGDIDFTRNGTNPDKIEFRTHYTGIHRTGDRTFTITFTLPGMEPIAVPFYRGGQSTVGAAYFETRFLLKLAPGFSLARSDPVLTETGAGFETLTTNPRYLTYIIEAPKAAGILDFTVGPWRFLAPADLAEDLRDVAESAIPYVEGFPNLTGFDSPYEQYLVAVEPGEEFDWEIGRAVGNGIIVLNGDAFRENLEKGQNLSVRRGLVHETFHAATTDAVGWSRVLSWWKEGTAVYAEHLVEDDAGPELRGCAVHERGATCYMNSSRIDVDDLITLYEAGQDFPLRQWSPDVEQTAETRRLGYAYSGYVVEAYAERYGLEAYRSVWEALAAVDPDEQSNCATCDYTLLEEKLRAFSGGATLDEILNPYRDVLVERNESVFRALVEGLVAPPYPTWDPPTRGGGTPTGDSPTGAGDDGDGTLRPARPSQEPTGLQVPGTGLLVALAGVAGAAVVARRRMR